MKPVITLVAGANGAGKSTLTAGTELSSFFPLLDPDVIRQSLQVAHGTSSDIAAARNVLTKAAEHMASLRSFAVETTLSGKHHLNMLDRARAVGYINTLIYIGTTSVDINLARVRRRVALGGHDVPEPHVRRRYQRSLRNLPIAIGKCDLAVLFDNSTDVGYRIVAVYRNGVPEWLLPPPTWAKALRSK